MSKIQACVDETADAVRPGHRTCLVEYLYSAAFFDDRIGCIEWIRLFMQPLLPRRKFL